MLSPLQIHLPWQLDIAVGQIGRVHNLPQVVRPFGKDNLAVLAACLECLEDLGRVVGAGQRVPLHKRRRR